GRLIIVGLVAHATPAARRRADEAGCDAAVGKFDRAGLVQTLRALLAREAGDAPQERAA
ncbi:MAG: hypothetical protein JNK46_02865, partial [Methylobacteriaceae bacterium]|nr:hypothetical protein [Methylobacteriaceae bacterium]